MNQSAEVLFFLIKVALGKETHYNLPNCINWEEVYELAIKQDVIALTWSDILAQKNEEWGVSEELKYKWIGQQMVVTMTNQQQWSAARSLGQLWLSHGINAVVLKGFSYAILYPNPLLRKCCDLDSFLFDRWEEGNKVVENCGVEVCRSYYKDSSFDYKGLHVENHRYCSPIRGAKKRKQYECFLRSLLTKSSLSEIEGLAFRTPSPLFNILFFLSHAQNHFLNEGGIQLRHVCDWGILMDKYSQFGTNQNLDSENLWAEVLKVSKEYGFLKFTFSISQVAKRVCGVEIPFDCPVNEDADRALLEEILSPTCVQVEFAKGWITRYKLVKSILQSQWKFKLYSDQSMFKTLLSTVAAFLFERKPVLN